MNNKNFKSSSYLASPIFMAIALILSFGSAYSAYSFLSGYLFFIFLLSAVSFLWGKFSEHGIDVDIKSETYHVYPGQELNMDFTLKNNKPLPLVWLEWIQDYPPNDCLEIPEDFQVCDVTNPQAETIIDPVLRKVFSFIRWYEDIEWTSNFLAKRRGVYIPKTVDIHTGDGFGLCVRKKQCTLPNPPVFVVYPKQVPVSTDLFFKNDWSASTGPHGVIEDVTVLRGTRDYMPNDPFKRINWRLAARSDELSVNIYDTIAPKSVYFFVDTTTFCGISKDNEEFEDTLSVVASLIEELFSLGMNVELYIPNLRSSSSLEDCLLSLARCDCDAEDAQFSQENLLNLYSNQSGKIYYVCYDATKARFENLFEEVGIGSFSVISHKELSLQGEDTATLSNVNLISTFKKV